MLHGAHQVQRLPGCRTRSENPRKCKNLLKVRYFIPAQAAEKTKPKDGTFLTAASPGVVALFQTNKHYSDHQQYVGALVPELAKEYRKGFSCSVLVWKHFLLNRLHFAVVEKDVILQLDCPDLAMGRHHAYSK